MTATAWSILPPIITIVLALWTKEVYMSLIIGIFSGAMLFAGGNFLQATLTMFQVMADKVGSNVNILVFLVISRHSCRRHHALGRDECLRCVGDAHDQGEA